MKFKIIYFNEISKNFNTVYITIKTVLHLAVEKGNIEIIKMLLSQSNIDINAKDEVYLLICK